MVFSYDVCNNSVQAGSTMMKHNEIGTEEKKDDRQKHLEIGKWSPANENVEVADIMPSVPLDIALLHIETDALLDSLRKSAITPQERTLSPSSTCSSTCSGISEGSQSPHNAAAAAAAAVSTSTSMCSSTHSSAGLNDDLSECSSKDFSYNSGSDDPDDLSIDSDDGMKGEIRKLSRATNELNQSIANLLIEHEHSSDGEEVYEIQDMPDASHSHSHADSHAHADSNAHADTHAHAHAHNSDETFALFIREMLSICEDFSKAFLRHQRIQDILRSKVLESLSKALRSNPRQAAYMYIILSAVVVTIRHQLKIL